MHARSGAARTYFSSLSGLVNISWVPSEDASNGISSASVVSGQAISGSEDKPQVTMRRSRSVSGPQGPGSPSARHEKRKKRTKPRRKFNAML
jgi:hypothetical protein